jgi:hypothetical protein
LKGLDEIEVEFPALHAKLPDAEDEDGAALLELAPPPPPPQTGVPPVIETEG